MSPSSVSLPPNEPSQNRTGEIIGASVTLLVLPTVAVALRLLSRWILRAGLWWDDFTIVIACVLCWGPNVVDLAALHYGGGRHFATIDPSGLVAWFKALYAFEFLYNLAMAAVKCSILLFLYRIFLVVQLRRILRWCTYFVICLSASCIMVSVFQCVPIHRFWNTLAGTANLQLGGGCIDVERYFIISGSIDAATNFAILALPIPILWRLKTSRPQKLVLTGIFTLGLTVCAVSITRLIILLKYNKRKDITWNDVPIAIWTSAEPSIAVVTACLPSLRPLCARLIWGGVHGLKPATYPSTSRYGSNSFNRLHESDHPALGLPWSSHNVKVYGGRRQGDDAESDDVEMADPPDFETPRNRIRMETTVVLTISERMEFRDDLF